MIEEIAIVNNKDEVVGKANRKEVHKKGLLHREAYLFIFNKKCEILLTMAADTNLWDCSVAGHFLFYESYKEGIIREANEELGINLREEELELTNIFRHQEIKPNQINNRFIGIYITNLNLNTTDLSINKEEISGVKYFNLKELQDAITHSPELFEPRFILAFSIWEKFKLHEDV